jgi:hypothetical protein
MNSGPDAEPDVSDAEVSELDTRPLQDAQDAIDRGREAARDALQDETVPGATEESRDTADDAGEQLEEQSGR